MPFKFNNWKITENFSSKGVRNQIQVGMKNGDISMENIREGLPKN